MGCLIVAMTLPAQWGLRKGPVKTTKVIAFQDLGTLYLTGSDSDHFDFHAAHTEVLSSFPCSLWFFQVVYRLVQKNWIHLTVSTPHVLTLLELWGQVVLHTRVTASVYYWKLWHFWRPPWNCKAHFLDTALQIKPSLQLAFLHRCLKMTAQITIYIYAFTL